MPVPACQDVDQAVGLDTKFSVSAPFEIFPIGFNGCSGSFPITTLDAACPQVDLSAKAASSLTFPYCGGTITLTVGNNFCCKQTNGKCIPLLSSVACPSSDGDCPDPDGSDYPGPCSDLDEGDGV
jgi:hypothetical protein